MNKGNLTKERIQQIWDYELISKWDEKGKYKMWHVVHSFMCRVHPLGIHKVGDLCFEDSSDYLEHLNLKRCLDIGSDGEITFQAYTTDVIGFIHARSKALSIALINGEDKPVILLNVNNYKWTKKQSDSARKFRTIQRREKLKNAANIKVKARSLSKKHSWDTVK